MTSILRTGTFGLALLLASNVQASIIRGTIAGEVTSNGNIPSVDVGSTVGGTFTYDDEVIASNFLTPLHPFITFNLTIGESPFVIELSDLDPSASPPGIVVKNPFGSDPAITFFLTTSVAERFTGFDVVSMTNRMPSAGISQKYVITSSGEPAANFGFTYNATIVPEPSTLYLVGLGLIGVWDVRRRRVNAERPHPRPEG